MIRAVITGRGVTPAEIAAIRAMIDDEEVCIVARPRVSDIIDLVADETGFTRASIIGESRKRDLTRARFATSLIAHRYAGRSLPVIAKVMGDRDHSTIFHQVRRGEALYANDGGFRLLVDGVASTLVPGGVM